MVYKYKAVRRKTKPAALEAVEPTNPRATWRGEYEACRNHAIKYCTPWTLDFETFCSIAKEPCDFCGGKTPTYQCNSVLLREGSLAYAPGGVLICCWPCKRIFIRGALREQLAQIQRIAEHLTAHQLDI